MNPNVHYVFHNSPQSVHILGLTVHTITHYAIRTHLNTPIVSPSMPGFHTFFLPCRLSCPNFVCITHLILRNQITVTTFMLWWSLWRSWLCDVILTCKFAAQKTMRMRSYVKKAPSWNSCQRDSSFCLYSWRMSMFFFEYVMGLLS
jgi:hypothetical protein